ncbi:hypothetical protein B842_09595 [Corynebacterium humireducens NBRC 106098 = DSM 45392]|uniref:DUF3558 domain-containing protein n=1 Tax=Corynebacterium humireducens NBRC 106098 = DSM 45392 TaxID=1223515 RepID=A0A0B5DC87_9CORY|nr:DUF3558 domain-containing protein [Corynebacterium humireducens]AJE33768.1 hypothetical protein B842_09595 [Corynebacterium humireducens NBRC 106098 = DSM 45392]
MPVRRLLPVALGALLTACSPTTLNDAPPAPTPEPAPVLELGDFDPAGDFAVFDPCTEIPPEVLAGAGLGERVREPSYDGGLSARCSYFSSAHGGRAFYTLTGDRVPVERIIERGFMVAPDADTQIPGVYLHHMGAGVPDECSAAVHTNRGRFVVQYTETLTTQSRDELCVLAIDKLENLFAYLGENNGVVHRS